MPDALPTPQPLIEDELELLAALVPLAGARLIELGCGAARLAANLLQRFPDAHVTGLEVDARQMAKNLAAPATPGLAFVNAGAQDIPFADTSSGANNNIVNWDWTFGNGTIGTLANESSTYTNAGTYVATLTTTNSNGCRATANTNVIINDLPVAGFTYKRRSITLPFKSVVFAISSASSGFTFV